jgi:phospholipase/carboxylesterase
MKLEYIEAGVPDGNKTVIWLHGLGADGHDFQPIVPELGLAPDHDIRFIFPHAPQRPVTINAGVVMRAWYDIHALQPGAVEDENGILDSEQRIIELIDAEIRRGVKPEHIILAGFSQGGAMALFTGLRYPQKLGGILALSCYLPLVSQFMQAEKSTLTATDIPIMQAHGTHDPVVSYAMGEDSQYYLNQLGYTVAWHAYPMQHSVCPEEIADISRWMQGLL